MYFWLVILALIIVIAVVAAVCAIVIPRSKASSASSALSSATNGGHPLSAAEGGVTIGKPGSIASYGNRSTDHFLLKTTRSSVVTRMDPIVDPNSVGAHVHRVHGSSYFTSNLTTATDMQGLAKCSTTAVQDDKSAYWVAQVYYQYPNGSMVAVPVYYTSLYYFMKAPTGETIYPFPDNYNIVVGDPFRREINASDT